MYSNIENKGEIKYSEAGEEEAKDKASRKVVREANKRLSKGRYGIIGDETDKFLEYPDGRGFPQG